MQVFVIFIFTWASFTLNAKEAGIGRLNETKNIPRPKNTHDEKLLKELLENGKRINELLLKRSPDPVIWQGDALILTGKVLKGVLLNTIVSTNLASPVLIRAHEGQGLAYNSKFSCSSVTQHKRVMVLCNKLISQNREQSITAQVLNQDGSSGLVGHYDDGKEELIAGAIASDFAKGVFSGAQERIGTTFGAIRDDSVKNQVLQGLMESGKTTSSILLDEMRTKEPVVTVEAGKEVLIYFMEAVNVK
jgi:hypothetical protein